VTLTYEPLALTLNQTLNPRLTLTKAVLVDVTISFQSAKDTTCKKNQGCLMMELEFGLGLVFVRFCLFSK